MSCPRSNFVVLTLACVLAACSGDDGDPTGPQTTNVAGTWAYSATNLTDGALLSCNVRNIVLSLSQSGSGFTGSYSTGQLTCLAGGAQLGSPVAGGTVVNGTVSGTTIAFDFDTPDFHMTGSVSGASASGTARVRVVLSDGQTFIVTGPWSAAKL